MTEESILHERAQTGCNRHGLWREYRQGCGASQYASKHAPRIQQALGLCRRFDLVIYVMCNYVCVYVYVYTCIYVHMYIYVYVHTVYTLTHTYTYIVHVYIYIHIHIHMSTCLCNFIYCIYRPSGGAGCTNNAEAQQPVFAVCIQHRHRLMPFSSGARVVPDAVFDAIGPATGGSPKELPKRRVSIVTSISGWGSIFISTPERPNPV